MTASKTIRLYLLIAYAAIFPVCCLVLLLDWQGMQIQAVPLGFILVAIGGVSTALSGALVAKNPGKLIATGH
jgi:hypothetical protein